MRVVDTFPSKRSRRVHTITEDAVEALWRSPARYLWAMLLARIYESAPLACPCYITDYVWGSSTSNHPSDYVSTTPTSRTVI